MPIPRPASNVVLGVDPGLQRTGFAFLAVRGDAAPRVVEAGVIRLDRRQSLAERLAELDAAMSSLLAAHRPATLYCEQLYSHYRHPRTAILMGHARGVILAAAQRAGTAVVSIGATRVKKLLTSSGHASKGQIQRAVAAELGLTAAPEPHDVADAIAIALCGWRSDRAAGALADGDAARGRR